MHKRIIECENRIEQLKIINRDLERKMYDCEENIKVNTLCGIHQII
jgi:hypothetical protein